MEEVGSAFGTIIDTFVNEILEIMIAMFRETFTMIMEAFNAFGGLTL